MQHINLCSQLDRVVEPPFSARQQFWVLVVVIAVMLGVYLVLWLTNNSVASELSELQQRQNNLAVELAQQKAKKDKLQQDTTVKNEIALLQSKINFRQRLLASVDPEASTGTNFAEHLTGLARQHIEGMWFTEIQLLHGGQKLALVGRSREPELLPRYLQKLTEEDIFSGHQFRVFRMAVPEDRADLLVFELRSNEQGSSNE